MRSTRVNITFHPSALVAGFLVTLAACGGPVGIAPAAPAPTAPAATAPPPPLPAEQVALDVFVDGVPVGHESWAVTRPADGSTGIAFDATLDERGAILKGIGRPRARP